MYGSPLLENEIKTPVKHVYCVFMRKHPHLCLRNSESTHLVGSSTIHTSQVPWFLL